MVALRLLAALFGSMVLVSPSNAAETQPYPSRPIRLLVPTSPSGASDTLARVVASELTQQWGQQMVVDNRPAGHGIVAMGALAQSPPDGYTLLLGNIGVIAINPGLYSKLPYDTFRDFTAVSLTTKQPFLLAINADVPGRTVAEFVQLAKAKPGQLSYGSGGNGSGTHVAMEMFKQRVGIDMVHVPYKGGGPVLNDVRSGQVQACMLGISVLLPHVRTGKLRGLAVTHDKRLSVAADLPTFGEAGVPNFEPSQWQGLIGPAKLGPELTARIQTATVRALQSERVADLLRRDGMVIVGSRPDEFAAFIKSEVERWSNVIKAARIKVE